MRVCPGKAVHWNKEYFRSHTPNFPYRAFGIRVRLLVVKHTILVKIDPYPISKIVSVISDTDRKRIGSDSKPNVRLVE